MCTICSSKTSATWCSTSTSSSHRTYYVVIPLSQLETMIDMEGSETEKATTDGMRTTIKVILSGYCHRRQ